MKLIAIAALALSTAGLAATPALAQAPVSAGTTQTAHDQELSSLIAKRIADDPALDADAIKVSVNAGVVTLSGSVPTSADRTKAEKLAHAPGVVKVENKLVTHADAKDKVKGTAGTVADKSKKGAEKAADKTKEGVSKTGEVITDGWITTRIKTNFMGDEALRASDIDVDTDNHVVTLSGTVVSAQAHKKALKTAKDVEGVKRVVDKLKVAPKN